MTSAAFSLQQAIFAALSADATLIQLLSGRIFDAVPSGAALPYLVLGEAEESPDGTATDAAIRHRLTLHIWSRAGGTREIKEIAAAVKKCLTTASLAPSGQSLVDLFFTGADYRRQSDGRTYRAALRFSALTEPTS